MLRRRTVPRDRVAALSPDREGIAIASVRREAGVSPVLELCAYQRIDPSEKLTKKLASVVKLHRLRNVPAVTLMEPNKYQLLRVDAPDVEPDEMNAAIRWRIKDLVDVDVENAVIDIFDAPSQVATGQPRKVYVVVSRREDVKSRIDTFSAAGICLDVIDIPELALVNVARMLPEDVGGVAFVYLGEEMGIINITYRGVLYLSRDIQFGTASLPDTAIHAGDEDTVNRWLDDVIIEIQRSLDYYESHYGQPRVSGLVIAPTDPEIPGIIDYLTGQLGLSARTLDMNELLDIPEELDRSRQARCVLAIGAALREEVAEDATADQSL